MSVDIRKVKKLIELLEESSLAEIEIHEGEESVRISRQSTVTMPVAAPIQMAQPMAPAPTAAMPAPAVAPAVETAPVESSESEKTLTGHVVHSPMVGTVYLAASPETDDFVSIGQRVSIGDTLCLVEAMKMFNQIEADKAGVIKARMVKTGDPIEFEQPLFIIE